MKICLANARYSPYVLGGAELSVQFLAEALLKEGHEVVVLCTAPINGVQKDIINGVVVYYVGLKNVYWHGSKQNRLFLKTIWHLLDTYNLFMAHAATNIIKHENPSIIHTNNIAGFSTALWHKTKTMGIPLVHTLRDYHLLCPHAQMYHNGSNCKTQCKLCKLYSISKRIASVMPDAVIGISNYILERHIHYGYFPNAQHLRVIHNSYWDSKKLPKSMPSKSKPRDNRALRFGYLGRLGEYKGIELLLKAFHNIPPHLWQLQIGGKGDKQYEIYLKSKYTTGGIQFKGFVKPEEILNSIDILIVPSLWQEPLGRTVLEAYAYGVPVIGSNRGGISEIIEDRVTGSIFNPDSIGSLTRIIESYIDNPSQISDMQIASYNKSKEFYPDVIANKYISLYRSLLLRE